MSLTHNVLNDNLSQNVVYIPLR